MQTQIFDRSYITDTAIGQFVAVVAGAEDGGVALPGAANAAGFMGFTQVATTAGAQPTSVRKLGVSLATSNGAITRGHHVGIASAAGDVIDIESAIDAAPGTAKAWQAIGVAKTSCTGSGALIEVFVAPSVINVAVS